MYLRISCFSLIVDASNDDASFVVDSLCDAEVAVLLFDNLSFSFLKFLRILWAVNPITIKVETTSIKIMMSRRL